MNYDVFSGKYFHSVNFSVQLPPQQKKASRCKKAMRRLTFYYIIVEIFGKNRRNRLPISKQNFIHPFFAE
jgi:hypothetical protein